MWRNTTNSNFAIELNAQRDDFCSITIELIFVNLGHGFKKANSVFFDIGDAWDKDFFLKSDYISLCLHNWVVLRCVSFTKGESSRVCSKYTVDIVITFY